jgi:uncharacterized membrane protein (TIGR02234 family)
MTAATSGGTGPRSAAADGRRLKTAGLLAALALAGLALLAWTQPWFSATLTGESAGHPPLSAAGDHAAPALSALALAALAATGALAIAGPVFRLVLAALQLVLGACIALSSVLALADPVGAVEPLVTAATSITGHEAVAALIGELDPTGWPFAALAAGVLLVLVDLGILATGRRWPASGRKYQAVRLARPDGRSEGAGTASDGGEDAVSDWDALSDGEDPTSRR